MENKPYILRKPNGEHFQIPWIDDITGEAKMHSRRVGAFYFVQLQDNKGPLFKASNEDLDDYFNSFGGVVDKEEIMHPNGKVNMIASLPRHLFKRTV